MLSMLDYHRSVVLWQCEYLSTEGDGCWVGADIAEHSRKFSGLHQLISTLWQMYCNQLKKLCTYIQCQTSGCFILTR